MFIGDITHLIMLIDVYGGYNMIQQYSWIWVNYNDLTVLPNPGIMVYFREIIPKWPYFRLVKYYNLPIYIFIQSTELTAVK